MDKKSEEYLSQYIKLTNKIKQKIESHANRYNIRAEICAWYSGWEDFCSDWCDGCGYTRTEARKLYHGGIGEFMNLPNGNGIVDLLFNRQVNKSFKSFRMEVKMDNIFRIEVDTGNGGYGFTDTLTELLADVDMEYGTKEVKKVSEWTKTSKDGDEYVSEDGEMHIFNMGKEIQ